METIISDRELEHAGFYWRELNGVSALVCTQLESAGFANGFSTRNGGVSSMPQNSLNLAGFNEDSAENILENRGRFLKLFPGNWALAGCWQVHGADVRQVKNLSDAKPAEDAQGDTVYCDAIVSDAPGVMAGVKTADCVPILNRVWGVTRTWFSRSAQPNPSAHTVSPRTPTATDSPGRF